MTKAKFAAHIFTLLAVLVLVPSLASAQSTISGVVRDTSGAVMPGVTVDAASEALIERSRTVTTNGEGRYALVDLRPGSYTVTFAIDGFNTVKQQVEVPANVTVPVDADMKPGSVGQTVEVKALVATVDVDDRKSPGPERCPALSIGEDALVVGTAVDHCSVHRPRLISRRISRGSRDTAHVYGL